MRCNLLHIHEGVNLPIQRLESRVKPSSPLAHQYWGIPVSQTASPSGEQNCYIMPHPLCIPGTSPPGHSPAENQSRRPLPQKTSTSPLHVLSLLIMECYKASTVAETGSSSIWVICLISFWFCFCFFFFLDTERASIYFHFLFFYFFICYVLSFFFFLSSFASQAGQNKPQI